jgi:hypothetical protein
MKTWKISTIVIASLAVVALGLLATPAIAFMGGFGGMMGGYGRGMMGGYGYGYNPYTNPTPTAPGTTGTYQPVYPFQFGGGCHRGFGFGYTTSPYTYTGQPLNVTTAKTIAQNYVTSTGNPDLTVKEIEEYTGNFYILVTEKSTGSGAFELLVDKYTGSIFPEMGPNMMWNTKYGMMRGGILRGVYGTPTTTMSVTKTQAIANAQEYLSGYIAGTVIGDVTTFYGYYTIEVLNNGTPYGMLSVNGYTGLVWFHTWHGTFVQEQQVG